MPSNNDTLHILLLYARHAIPFLGRLLYRKILALQHQHTYQPPSTTTNTPVVVIGASFAGLEVARRLAQTLPSGHRVVLLERNSHLHYVFAFPRFSVVPGYEESAFVPYTGLEQRGIAPGVLERRVAEVVGIREGEVLLAGGEVLAFEALVVATGCQQKVPARLGSRDLEGGCAELKGMQDGIKAADRIAIVGGGAVGVELAADIKDYYPGKEVTLVHSRAQLLNSFGARLHEHSLQALEGLGVKVVLRERPAISDEAVEDKKRTLTFSGGRTEEFDLIIPCTGQQPNSSLLSHLSPSSISKQTSRILVNDHLQVCDPDLHVAHPNVFALGDVAETGGPKMARAAMMQAETVVKNILALIKTPGSGKATTLETYTPQTEVEGAIKLTLGLKQFAIWMQESASGRELMLTSKRGREDMGVAQAWSWYGTGAKNMPKRKTV